MLQKLIYVFQGGVDLKGLKTTLGPYLDSLRNMEFELFNPLIWLLSLIALFILSRSWGFKKSFTYCLTILIILLGTTKLEHVATNIFAKSGTLDFTIFKMVAILLSCVVTIYYIFVKNE